MNSPSNSDGLRRIRRLLWAAVAGSALAFGGAVLWRAFTPPDLPAPRVTGEAAIVNAYTLTDHTGQTVTADSFDGQWQLVFFGFTHCPDICPTTLAYLAQSMDALGPDAAQVTPIFITVDPARDTPDVMTAYVEAFHPRLVGLTGTEAQVDEAVANFRAYAERLEDETDADGYMVSHSGIIYLMRPNGAFEAAFREYDQTVHQFAATLSWLIEKG
ncbi:MAG: SCO family protein [Pikeienuella sp.]|uniref:SCO family protein n=1 Tax=Pikeienuella sp. TaxID=2831957 RepID=UPI00391A9B4E